MNTKVEKKLEENLENFGPVWSFWKTMGISLLIIVVGNVFVQFLIIVIHLLVNFVSLNHLPSSFSVIQKYTGELFQKSYVISESILISDFFSLLMILYFVSKKNKINMIGYLGFNNARPVSFIVWQIVMIAFFYGTNFIASQTSIEEPEFMRMMRDMLRMDSFGSLALMLAAVVVAAPLFEEIMFRGFMYTGILKSRLGIFGAILIPSIIWSLIHAQYEIIWIVMIFFTGLMFTLARYQTGSIYTVIAMHAVNNFLSFVDVIQK
ncbi:MAG: CPBP family intramembrane metalloprotease [Spirochaetia bacterium]|nr:CPBP family intramembrane metalloprotease [Spirochaetia bacterium]